MKQRNNLIAKWLGIRVKYIGDVPNFTCNLQLCIDYIMPKLFSLGVDGYIIFNSVKSKNRYEIRVADLVATTDNPASTFCDLVIRNFIDKE